MINWARAHPIWAALLGVGLLFVIWMLFFRSGGSSEQVGVVGVTQQDPSLVAAGMQIQAMQLQGGFAGQQAQIAADVEIDRNAVSLAIASLQAQFQTTTVERQAEIAAQQIAASQHTTELQSTLAAQIEASRIQAEQQTQQLYAASQAQMQQSQNAMLIAIQQSNAGIHEKLIDAQESTQKAAIKAQPKQSLLSKICVLTTAYVTLQGRPDNCEELTLARMWRDEWLVKQPCGHELVAIYYASAPRFLEVATDNDTRAIGHAYIDPFTSLVKSGDFEGALLMFVAMLEYIGRQYDAQTVDSLNAWHACRSRYLLATSRAGDTRPVFCADTHVAQNA